MPCPVAVIAGADGRVLAVNRAWARHAEASIGAVTLGDVFPAAIEAALEVVREAGPVTRRAVQRSVGPGGVTTWWDLDLVPYPDAKDAVLVIAREVTDHVLARREAEAAFRKAAGMKARVMDRTRALTEAAEELAAEMRRRQEAQTMLLQSQKMAALGQLTAGVAHDFNNLLTAILGSFELIERRTNEPKVIDLVTQGKSAASKGASLTRQLLDFARREPAKPVVLNVEAALRAADELFGHAVGPGIVRVLDVQPGTWPVLADAHQLQVALLNLAVNARDAMPRGGTLTLVGRNLSVWERPEALPQQDYVAISVRDTGEGMEPGVLARATEAFFTTKGEGQGTGLGLAMVNGFATRSGGCLRIESRPGDGTVVEIILPRAAVSGMDRASDVPEAGPVAVGPRLKGTILLVEDDDLVREITVGYLRDQGYTVVNAPNAEAAIVLSHSIETLDLLLTDVRMPGLSGPALAERLRAERPDLSVLFLTALADQDGLAGEDVLPKPFTGAELGKAIQRRLPPSDADAPEDGRLLRRIRSPALCAAYLVWRTARDGGRPPRLPDLEWGDLPEADNAFTVAVEADGNQPAFRFLRVGRALTGRLGRPLDGTLAFEQPAFEQDNAVLGSLESAYRRCARTLSPSYEYARYDFGDGQPMVFERLILPASDDGHEVTHLVGIALFAD